QAALRPARRVHARCQPHVQRLSDALHVSRLQARLDRDKLLGGRHRSAPFGFQFSILESSSSSPSPPAAPGITAPSRLMEWNLVRNRPASEKSADVRSACEKSA